MAAPKWLTAIARDLPSEFEIGGRRFRHLRTFKHDFFAATGLYEDAAGKVILKIGRQTGVFGLPMSWAGRWLARHEASIYRTLGPVYGVPRLLGLWGPTGLVHEYVEGRPLAKGDALADEFFPRLSAMLDEIHSRDVAYVDLEKRENILLGSDGKPYLIDFQISWHWPANRGGRTWPARFVLKVLQQSDRYHLLKHWRRLRPDQLEGRSIVQSYTPPFWIRWHRFLFRPMTLLRRRILVWLGARSSASGRSPG